MVSVCVLFSLRKDAKDREGFFWSPLKNREASLGVLGPCSFVSHQLGRLYEIKSPNKSGLNNGQKATSHIARSWGAGLRGEQRRRGPGSHPPLALSCSAAALTLSLPIPPPPPMVRGWKLPFQSSRHRARKERASPCVPLLPPGAQSLPARCSDLF